MKTNAKENLFSYVVNTVIIFCFLFEMPIFGPITTRMLSCIYAVGYLFIFVTLKNRRGITSIDKRYFIFGMGMIICFMICLVNTIGLTENAGNQYQEPHYYIYIILYTIVFSLFCTEVFNDISDFARVIIPIMLFQSLVIFMSVINTPFRLYIYEHFYFGDDRFDITVNSGTRIIGIALHSATGSLILCCTCFLLVYLVLSKRIKTLPFIILYIIICIATAFIARTGFYIEILLMIVYAFAIKPSFKKLLQFAAILVFAILLLSFILSRINPVVSDIISRWIGEIFTSETRFNTINEISKQSVPRFSSEMIFGTNVILGKTPSGAIMGSDSGYVKTYCSIGVVGALVYYSSFVYFLFNCLNDIMPKSLRMLSVIMIVIAFLIEFKEPFFQKYIFSWFLLTLMKLSEKESCQTEGAAVNV